MSKIQTVKNAVVDEIIISPNADVVIAALYTLYTDTGEVITQKRDTITRTELNTQALTALNSLAAKVLNHFTVKENL